MLEIIFYFSFIVLSFREHILMLISLIFDLLMDYVEFILQSFSHCSSIALPIRVCLAYDISLKDETIDWFKHVKVIIELIAFFVKLCPMWELHDYCLAHHPFESLWNQSDQEIYQNNGDHNLKHKPNYPNKVHDDVWHKVILMQKSVVIPESMIGIIYGALGHFENIVKQVKFAFN